ncbi:MAG: hypothetical protein CM1200mP9_06230 [Gammaproteobacteria bacterium]|nr:MAG: hypothetical protein CM1200mP9_06230 [Gammaproteobacteria bacterium]
MKRERAHLFPALECNGHARLRDTDVQRLVFPLHANHAWVDDAWLDVTNLPSFLATKSLALGPTARSGDGKWRVALYGLNLTNEKILTNISGPTPLAEPSPNRTRVRLQY